MKPRDPPTPRQLLDAIRREDRAGHNLTAYSSEFVRELLTEVIGILPDDQNLDRDLDKIVVVAGAYYDRYRSDLRAALEARRIVLNQFDYETGEVYLGRTLSEKASISATMRGPEELWLRVNTFAMRFSFPELPFSVLQQSGMTPGTTSRERTG